MIQGTDEPTGRPDAPILLVTKLHPPFVPAQTVVRERLFDRLRDGRGLKLSLVACPAGFGKSTLLAAWREREAQDRPVAWVTLDEGDNDAVVLWSHVIEALGRACPGLPHAALAATAAASPLLEMVLPRLVNALAEQGEVVLVLDDFHRLSSASARESVAWFVDRLPSSVQLVLSTRSDPGLPLGALRAHGQLLELRADDLRFTGDEAGEFLNGRLGLDLDAADVDLLVARTEGWPAGIYLAALSLAGKADKPGLVQAFDGTSAHVVDFLVERGARRATSRTCSRSCCARRCSSGSARSCATRCSGRRRRPARSTSLARTNLFLLPLDDRRRWFRFHHLFAQLLRVELERREPGAARRAAPARVRVAQRVRHDRRGDPPRRRRAARSPRPGALIAETWVHYVNAGRTAVRPRLAGPDSPRRSSTPTRASCSSRPGPRRCAAARPTCARAVARVRELGGLEDGPAAGRLRLPRVEPRRC